MAIIPPDQKFHTIDPTTPTPERGSVRTNSMHEIYTMQDIIDSVGGGGGGGVSSLETLTGDLILQGAGGVSISDNGTDTITITGGATIGEKLDYTVRDTAYTGVTGEHEGIDLKVGNTSVTAGVVYELGEAAGPVPEWFVTDASILALSTGLLAVATDTGAGVNMMQKGLIVMPGASGLKNGTNLYLSASSPGTLTMIPPSGTGEVVRLAGYVVDQTLDLVYFDPSQDWIEII